MAGQDAERSRALILLRATLDTVAARLDDDRPEDLGLIVRMTELADMVEADLRGLPHARHPPAATELEPAG